MEMKIYLLLLCASLACCSANLDGKDSVPVLIWDTHKEPDTIPGVSALQVVPFRTFKDKYLNLFESPNILLFIQDELSIEDLSSHVSELKNVVAQSEKGHSLFLPSVHKPSSLIHELDADPDYKVTTLKAGSSLAGLPLDDTKKKYLVVVELPSTITNPSRKRALQKTDEIVENVLSKIGQTIPFTIIFTGRVSSARGNSKLMHRRIARSLAQSTPTNVSNFHTSPCVMLYIRSDITVYKNGKLDYTLTEKSSLTGSTGDCSKKDIATIKILYKDIKSASSGTVLDKVNVEFLFKGNGRSWWLTDAKLFEMSDSRMTADLYPSRGTEKIPVGKAYSCGQTQTLRSRNSTSSGGSYKLNLNGMQVQAFTANGQEKFDDSWDCIGFFTIPIWTGIIAGVILVFILLFGLYMLSDVKTMDRFDDPKGKHFMVASTGNE